MEFGDFAIELLEDSAEWAWQLVVVRQQGRPVRSEEAEIELRIEEGDFEAVTGDAIAVGLRDPVNETLEAQPPEVVGHRCGRVGPPEQRLDVRAQVSIVKAARQMRKAREGLEERHDARIAEPQGGDALPVFEGWSL